MDVIKIMKKYGACYIAIEWAHNNGIKTLRDAWDTCQRSDWMLWALDEIGYSDEIKLRTIVCRCVRETRISDSWTVWDLLTDERSKNAVIVTERFIAGDATRQDLSAAAWAAADADAWAAAWAAARDDASAAAREQQADIIREVISFDLIEGLIK